MFLKCWQQIPIFKSENVIQKSRFPTHFEKQTPVAVSRGNNRLGLIFSSHSRAPCTLRARPSQTYHSHDPEHHICAILILMAEECFPNPHLHAKWENPRNTKTAIATCFLHPAYFFHLHYHPVLIRHLSLQPVVYAFSQIMMGTVIILPKVIKNEALKKLIEPQVYSS